MAKLLRFNSKTESVISVTGLIAVISSYIIWVSRNGAKYSFFSLAGSLIATLLFIYICLIFVKNWLLYWSPSDESTVNNSELDTKPKPISLVIIFMCTIIICCIFITYIVYVHDHYSIYRTNLTGLETFMCADTEPYLFIAENGFWYLYYLVFYPLYPILINLLTEITKNYMYSAILISCTFYSLSACMLYLTVSLEYGVLAANRIIKYIFLAPPAFFFAAPMSESLFFFLSLTSIYLLLKRKWIFAGLFGAAAAFTRSLGILIIAPHVFILVHDIVNSKINKKNLFLSIIGLFIVPFGTLTYFYINYRVAGNPLYFKTVELNDYGQSIGFFFNTVAYQIDYAMRDICSSDMRIALGEWIPNIAYTFAVLIIMAISAKRMKAYYLVWFICYFFLSIGLTSLWSGPRYLLACIPIYFALPFITKSKIVDTVLSIICLVSLFYYSTAYALNWNVM